MHAKTALFYYLKYLELKGEKRDLLSAARELDMNLSSLTVYMSQIRETHPHLDDIIEYKRNYRDRS